MQRASRAHGASPVAVWPLIALGALTGAEVVSQMGAPAAALVIDVLLLLSALSRAARPRNAERNLAIAIAVVALERPLSLAVPSLGLGTAGSYLLLGIPTSIGIALAARVAGYTRRDIGLVADSKAVRLSIVMIPVGLLLGVALQLVARPLPVLGSIPGASLGPSLAAAVVAIGLVEEVLYRGLVQRAATQRLSPANGIAYTSALYSALAWTAWTPTGINLVFLTALALGTMTRLTGSVVPAITTHASLNVGLLLIGPLVVIGTTVN